MAKTRIIILDLNSKKLMGQALAQEIITKSVPFIELKDLLKSKYDFYLSEKIILDLLEKKQNGEI